MYVSNNEFKFFGLKSKQIYNIIWIWKNSYQIILLYILK